MKSRAGYTVLAFACSNRASGSTHRSSQSNTNAVLIPSKFNAFPQHTHTLFGVFFLSSPLSSFIQVSEETVLSLSFSSDVRTRTLVSTASKQSKEGRHPLSLSSPHTSITDESRAFTVSKRNRIAHHFHTRRRSIF